MASAQPESNPQEEQQSTRRPYVGSCHCGSIRYIAWLALPATPPYTRKNPEDPLPQLIRKCNCSVCHKFGLIHVRLQWAPRDFALILPSDIATKPGEDPLAGMLCDYRGKPGSQNRYYFCRNCGTRCFLIEGESEIKERDLAAEGVDLKLAKIDGDGKRVLAWGPKDEGWSEDVGSWFMINALTLEPGQEGFDLREWYEKKWIQYVNWREEIPGASYERPYAGGCY